MTAYEKFLAALGPGLSAERHPRRDAAIVTNGHAITEVEGLRIKRNPLEAARRARAALAAP